MSREEFAESEYQYLVQEMRRMVTTKFDKLHKRLDRVEKRDQRARMSSSQKVDSRVSRRYTSNDYSRRDYYRDSFSSRNSRRREADFDFESFREEVLDERYTSSRAPKKIATERSSRRIVRESYVNDFSSFEQNDFSPKSFVTYCKKQERKEEDEKQKEIKRKERQEKIMRENERILNEIERRNKENERILNEIEKRNKEMKEKEKEIESEKENEIEKENEKEFEREKACEQEKRVEKEIEIKETSGSEEKESSENDVSEQARILSTNTYARSFSDLSFQVPKSPYDQIQLRYLQNERLFQLFEKGKSVDDRHPLEIEGKEGKESLFIESRPLNLKIIHKDFDGITSEKLPSFDLANYCSHINVNDVDSIDATKISFYDMFYNRNSVDSVGLVHPVQIVNFKVSLIHFCDLSVKMKFLLQFGISDQNRVVKLGVSQFELFPRKGKHYDLIVIVSHSTPFDDQGSSDDESFFASKWPDLRTSRFEDRGNDVSTLGASSSANQDLNELPKGPITQAHAEHFLEAILASNAKPWFETRANAHKISLKQLSKGPVHCWQADPSSFPAPRAPSSSTQLI
ncbi:hypothetical protein PVK06_043360 [Gossypium arboreum]|uniref:Uncharacterized protein n=1 Tax=Gossypium arboreum TaxID=29729 RepID=A0ABR0MNG2_GOSAR|nr:hypothetical protein PVK06_043360 [Gossypium arboreum]